MEKCSGFIYSLLKQGISVMDSLFYTKISIKMDIWMLSLISAALHLENQKLC